ncbi:MAG: hypothetical protein ACUZ8H_15130 [Candidatus Anammoxibacter sp.]
MKLKKKLIIYLILYILDVTLGLLWACSGLAPSFEQGKQGLRDLINEHMGKGKGERLAQIA